MLPDHLPQLVDTLLRLPRLEKAQLRELIQHLPDPEVSAEEMLRRGWITQDQFSALFADAQPRPTSPETLLFGFGDDDTPPDAECDDWGLTVSDDEDSKGVPLQVGWACPARTADKTRPEAETEAVAVLSGAASAPPFEWGMLVPPVADGDVARRPDRDAAILGKVLLLSALFVGCLLAAWQLFTAKSTVPPVAHQEFAETKKKPRVPADKHQVARPQIAAARADKAPSNERPGNSMPVPVNNDRLRADLLNRLEQNLPPAAPVAADAPVPPKVETPVETPARVETPSNDAKPKSTASLYDRVRQIVREKKTEETERLGFGDIAYQDVPDDGSIMVGMDVSYATVFNDRIIKSVRPIYQKPNGTRYGGRVYGNSTQVGERLLAERGYAIGGVAIKAGAGIEGLQVTFMEIGPERLNPYKTYQSKWLGSEGGAEVKMFVNDGRPIVGIAGMRARDPSSPAFCLCLVTTQTGALADADGRGDQSRDALANGTEQKPQPAAPVATGPAPAPQARPMPPRQVDPLQELVRQQMMETAKQNMPSVGSWARFNWRSWFAANCLLPIRGVPSPCA